MGASDKAQKSSSRAAVRSAIQQDSNGQKGNLRDFRIDHSTETERVTPPVPVRSAAQPARRPVATVSARQMPATAPRRAPAPARVAPAQKPAPAKPAMNEWSASPDELWSNWTEEAHENSLVDLSQTAPASLKPAPNRLQAPAPLVTRTSNLSDSQAELVQEENLVQQSLQSEEFIRQPWATQLALEERRAERLGTVDYSNGYQKQELLKQRTAEFTAVLQNTFRKHVDLFNESRHSAGHSIHIYKISKTAEDFMLFRNGVKLIVSGQRSGLILFAFNQYVGQIFAPTSNPTTQIEASWGPFDQLYWSFKGERVQVLDLVRYFLTEFVRQSFR